MEHAGQAQQEVGYAAPRAHQAHCAPALVRFTRALAQNLTGSKLDREIVEFKVWAVFFFLNGGGPTCEFSRW